MKSVFGRIARLMRRSNCSPHRSLAGLRILETTARELRDRSKSHAIVLGNLGLAYIRQGKVDDAVAVLHQAVDVIEMTWGGGGLNIIFGACRELQPWRNVDAVQDVYDRVMALMTA